MMDKKIMLSELPEAQSMTGLYFLATNAQGKSVKVSAQTIIDAATTQAAAEENNE